MADISINFAGITSPNPFWLASGPLSNTGYQVHRAFEAGWGGAVWKTVGEPIINTTSRLGGMDYGSRRLVGLNNIELISDRSIEDNLREIREVKRAWPDRAVIVSLMVDSDPDIWHDIVRRVVDTGADGIEMNFGCPHGMSERGMGSAVGQVPEYTERITSWAVEASEIPVIVKLTPNVTDVRFPGRAAVRGGAHGLSLINTINSLMGLDVDTLLPIPHVGNQGAHGGYCGPAVKPIALHMISSLAREADIRVPISGIGGVETWRDAVEFIALGSTSVQVCTAAMHYGFRMVRDLTAGLSDYLDEHGIPSVMDLVGRAVPAVTDWGNLDLNYRVVARIDAEKCIGCNLCHIACEDGAHQCIDRIPGQSVPKVDEDECVGCNLCALVCPVDGCITMTEVPTGKPPQSWNERQKLMAGA